MPTTGLCKYPNNRTGYPKAVVYSRWATKIATSGPGRNRKLPLNGRCVKLIRTNSAIHRQFIPWEQQHLIWEIICLLLNLFDEINLYIVTFISWVKKMYLPSVVKTSTSQRDSDPSTPTSCRKTCWPISGRAHVKVFVIPSSTKKAKFLIILQLQNVQFYVHICKRILAFVLLSNMDILKHYWPKYKFTI